MKDMPPPENCFHMSTDHLVFLDDHADTWRLTTESDRWFAANITGDYRIERLYPGMQFAIFFYQAKDAIMYKLKWDDDCD